MSGVSLSKLNVALAVSVHIAAGCSPEGSTDHSGPRSVQGATTSEPDGGDGGAAVVPPDAGEVPVEHLKIAANGFVFDALAAGPVDGDLVLLLHGFPETSLEWNAQLPVLARAGYRAVAPDQRGYSPGARPTDVAAYGIINLIGDAGAIATELGYDRFHIVGHDWGGGVAWGVAGVAPARVRTVTVLSTPHPAAFQAALSDPMSCQYMASAYFDVLDKPNSNLASLSSLGLGYDGVPAASQKFYQDNVLGKPEVLDAALSWYRANVMDRKLTGTVGNVTVPTLYIWGSADPTFCRVTAEDTANYVTGPYRFVPVDGGGHWLAEANAAAVNTALLAHLTGG